MKKRWRSKSRKSAGPASPSRSGGPTSPCRSGESASSPDRSGETAASSDRSGGRASSASTDPVGEGGDERMDHRRSGGGDGSPSPGEEAAVRPKRRRRKEKRRASDPVVPIPGGAMAGVTEALKHKDFQGTVPASSISGEPASPGVSALPTSNCNAELQGRDSGLLSGELVSDPVASVSLISGEPTSPGGSALPTSNSNADLQVIVPGRDFGFVSCEPTSSGGSALPTSAYLQVTAPCRDFSFVSGAPASSDAVALAEQWKYLQHKERMEHEKKSKEREKESMESLKKWMERKKERKKCKKAKQRKREKQCLSGPHPQHDALVIEESSTMSEQQQQQQYKTSSSSPNLLPNSDCFAVLQDAEASAAPPSGKIKGKRVGRKGRGKKIPPSDSTQKSNVVGVHGNVQEAITTHASLPREEESINQNTGATLKKGCLDDAEPLMDQSALRASCSSSQSGDAQEEAPFDGLRLKMDNKPEQSCSGDCAKIAHAEDEDEHSYRRTSPVVEDELHSDKLRVHATIEDRKQEQRRAQIQALLGIDDHTLSTEISYFLRHPSYDRPKNPYFWSEYDEPQQLIELYQRLAFYRIRGYELSVDRKLDKLDDANLAKCYPPDILYEAGYFKDYEDSLEWYFDPELCKYSGFEDYQRLVLHNDGEYRDWDCYQSTHHTYEIDLAYVKYCEAMEKETKWIEDYLSDISIPAIPLERVKNVAHLQALKIAAGFPNVPPSLVSSGFRQHMWSIKFDFRNYMGLDGVYFEIWKRVAKQKMDFREALSELYREKMFPLRSYDIEQELENKPLRRWSMKDNYDAYVASIGDLVSDDEALPLITEAVKNMCPKSKSYVDYARKKMAIAREIGLITEGRTEVTRQCQGDNGEAKINMDS